MIKGFTAFADSVDQTSSIFFERMNLEDFSSTGWVKKNRRANRGCDSGFSEFLKRSISGILNHLVRFTRKTAVCPSFVRSAQSGFCGFITSELETDKSASRD